MTAREIPFLDDLVAIRRDLHAHPELSFDEKRTAAIVARELSRYGLEVHEGLAETGVVGVLRHGSSNRAIGLRADMDALPLHEKNSFAHCSTHEGLMHACGHDGHTAMLLGAARYLAENRDHLDIDGVVYFIFQPAEEAEAGALQMIDDGLFSRFPMEAVFGLHNWPGIPVGEMVVMPGRVMAGTCDFEITIRGQGCHAGMPNQGTDTLVAASHLVLALQTIISRGVNPCEPAVVSVTQIHGGDAMNIIPDEAILKGTTRSFSEETQQFIEERIKAIGASMMGAFGVQITVEFDIRYPATVNSARETELCRRAAESLLGEHNVRRNELPSMSAEDFSYMLREKPGCYVWLGNGPVAGGCSLHNPSYDFNDELLPIGINYWVRLVETAL